jgi:hypothetical protein
LETVRLRRPAPTTTASAEETATFTAESHTWSHSIELDRLAGEYWYTEESKRDPRVQAFAYGLRTKYESLYCQGIA